ncbi:MAG: hypothetical protein R3A45_06075 [Bdellovibrionota bacterium]|nr:hypothetical protein [Deltaproteobacteria bacterium]
MFLYAKKYLGLFVCVSFLILLLACEKSKAPLDSNHQSPEDVMLSTYTLIVNGEYDRARQNFSDQFIDIMLTKHHITFEKYCENTKGWKVQWLKTQSMGNQYNKDMWRVKIIPDEGKGPNNGPGIVQDFYLIDGQWKIVFWGDYPKT